MQTHKPAAGYRVAETRAPGYLHATITGANTSENIRGYMRDLLEACRATGARYLLVEERLDGPRLRTIDVYELVVAGAEDARGRLAAVAYVDVNAIDDSMMKFAESVAVSRGVLVKVFSTVPAAKEWIATKANLAPLAAARAI
ncbi:MAG TPA: hypothetical protein VNH12_00445 [Burkholderiales bacterium]|nr:hypothetical protein [Burkholderiales bacterium]